MAGLLLCSTGGWCCWVITKGKYKLVWHPQKNWPVHTWYALIVSKFLICALHVASPLFFFLTSVDFCSEFKLIQWSSSTEVFLCSSSLFLPFTYEVNWSEVKWLSHVRLFATPWTVAYQAPPSLLHIYMYLIYFWKHPPLISRNIGKFSLILYSNEVIRHSHVVFNDSVGDDHWHVGP